VGTLDGKVAIVTGAAKGQGAAAARVFVREGARVVLTDIDTDPGEQLSRELRDEAIFVTHDVSRNQDWARVVTTCLERFGRLDVLLNNAGIYDWLSIEETDEAEFERFWRVNQLGTFLGMRAAIAPMKAAGGGSIINVSSVGGAGGYPGIFAYATSKWAIRGMTKCAARDLGRHKIRVNSILPGVIRTKMIAHLPEETIKGWLGSMPLGRIGEPDDVAKVAAFLASDASAYMTGTDVVVDAGMVA
jgi:3alpha(or 20beta)-hydroxysteroid dehydrogenase